MVLALSTLLVVGAWSLLWFGMASFAKKEISNWAENETARGNVVSFESVSLSGYPGTIVLEYTKPEIKYAFGVGGAAVANKFIWKGENARLEIKPWAPWQGEIDLAGQANVNFATTNGQYNMAGKIAKFNVSVNPGNGLFDELKINIGGLELSGSHKMNSNGTGASRTPSYFMADALKLNLISDISVGSSGAAIKILFHGSNMILPWAENAPISNRVQLVDISAKLSGPLVFGQSINDALINWKKNDGKLIVDNMVLHGTPFAISGAGNINLDENMQPGGRMTAKITGLLPTINRFRDVGLIRDSDAVVAKMTLAALSQKTKDGRSFLNLGVEVRKSVLYLGPIAIAKLSPVKWQ